MPQTFQQALEPPAETRALASHQRPRSQATIELDRLLRMRQSPLHDLARLFVKDRYLLKPGW